MSQLPAAASRDRLPCQDQGLMIKPREMPLRHDTRLGGLEPSGWGLTLLKTALAGRGLD